MKREYIIVGRKKDTAKWIEFGFDIDPIKVDGTRRTWRPDLDNIEGAIRIHRLHRPNWEFRAARV